MPWIIKYNTYLTEAESLQNAQEVVNFLYGTLGWSKNAVSAICGNMRHESTINPDLHEQGYGDSPERGYGLVQWTPKTKYTEWANANALPIANGVSQLKRIQYEADNNIQYYPTVSYPETFKQFQQSNRSIDYLTEAFCWNYERPNATAGNESMPKRKAFAHRVFNECTFDGSSGGGGIDPNPPSDGSGGVPDSDSSQIFEKENEMSYYKVKPGDNLSNIARNHGVSMNDIQRVSYNQIPNKNIIYDDEILFIPNQKTREYRVVAGDTLGGIANKLRVTVQYLVNKNNLKDPDKIYVGQYLKY